MASLWPYIPVGDVVEVLEWLTDVIRTQSAEQRIALRDRPRRRWQFGHVFSHDQHAGARSLVRAADGFLVPDWSRLVYGGPVAAGANVVLTCTTTGLDIEAGGQVAVIADAWNYEVCTLAAVAAGSITLASVTSARASAAVYPLDAAHLGAALATRRPAGRHIFADIAFDAAGVVDCAASAMPAYRGHDLLTDIPVVGAGALEEGIAWPSDLVDNAVGAPVAFARRSLPDDRMMMRWHVFSAADKRALRQWLHSRRGRLAAFWRSTLARDLTAAAGIDAAATALTVYAPEGSQTLGETAFDLEINGLALYRRRVTGVAVASPVNGRPALTLTLDSALGATHTAGQLGRISFLRCLRLDSDRIELHYSPGAGMVVAAPCIEVPLP